jgi:membrane protein YqaA with SNARE-associated domain
MNLKIKALVKLFGVVVTVTLSLIILFGTFMNKSFLENYRLMGVFLAALFSHSTIIARGLFTPLFLSLTEYYSPVILGFTAGLGGAFGELTAYYWGLGIKETLNPGEHKDPIPKWAEKYGLIIALIFASSPLPDTPIMLLAGSLRFPLWKLVLIQVAGKSIFYSLGAAIGSFIFMELKSIFEEIIVSILILAASIILCAAASWSRSREKILRFLEEILDKLNLKTFIK